VFPGCIPASINPLFVKPHDRRESVVRADSSGFVRFRVAKSAVLTASAELLCVSALWCQ
jgi:hypothetical protein